MSATTFGSVCSGIEAASVAFGPLGWRAAWVAEIEPFPCAVLAHHYPEVPNLGDMTTIAARLRAGEIAAPDVLCGGTPCQSFSSAGLRRSLDDQRGNLSLAFCELADAIDDVRCAGGKPASVVLWENVPGVLSTHDNAFGCFLAALAGLDTPIVPPSGWTDAGVVDGPRRAVAWRVLDAQFFGLAQRRRRVFVVASARAGFDPAAVLLEFDGVRRDLAPRREAWEEAAAGTLRSTDGGCDVDHARAGHVVGALTAACGPNGHGGSGLATDKGAEAGHILAFGGNRTSGPIEVAPALLAQPGSGWKGDFESETFIAHTLRGEGFDASEDGTGRGTPLVPVLPFYTTQVTSATNRCRPEPGDPCHPLAAGAHPTAIAFPANLSGTPCAAAENLSPSLGATNPTAVAIDTYNQTEQNTAHTLRSNAGMEGIPATYQGMQVRRLTPRECERLQGFPDDYTAIPWRGKPAAECPDGPRYKALGNSWAVPCVRWIGARIDAAMEACP